MPSSHMKRFSPNMNETGKRRRLALDSDLASANRSAEHSRPETNPWTGRQYSRRFHALLEGRRTLPVHSSKQRLLDELDRNPVVILEGETGSGKTTQVPQFLVEAGYTRDGLKVACTQPRRVAAMSVAKRVAEEMDVSLGEHVGYTIRFEDRTSTSTVLKYMTDGMLLREAMSDHALSAYSVIVLDEAHERTLSTDVLMGLLKEIMARRSSLRVIVMSATMNTKRFQAYFNNAPLLTVPGRMFPVEILYSPNPEQDYVVAAVRTVIHICKQQPPGDILLFLTGEEEIEECVRTIEDEMRGYERTYGETVVLPLYGSLPPDRQQKVFDPAPRPMHRGAPPGRKVICATNIAETSLTIDGVVYVVDSGFSKQKIYNPRARVESLLPSPISRASAKQRSGRAGRTRPGKCYRLYTKEAFDEELNETTYPEILRCNLGNVVLHLKMLGIDDLVHFDFMDPPAPETLMRALELLNYLGALDDEGDLTDFGRQMSQFPLEPELAAALIKSPGFGCSEEVVSIVAMLSAAHNCFIRVKKKKGEKKNGKKRQDNPRRRFEHSQGDHLMLLNVYHSFLESMNSREGPTNWCWNNYINFRAMKNAQNVREQLRRLMLKAGLRLVSMNPDDRNYTVNIRKAILCGFFMHVAYGIKSKDKAYLTVKDNQRVLLHPSCGMSRGVHEWVMYNEYVCTNKDYIRTCSSVEGKWLIETAEHYYDLSNFPAGEAREELQRICRKMKRKKNVKNDS